MAFLKRIQRSCRWALILSLSVPLLTACSGMFFYPQERLRLTPDILGIQYRDVYLTTRDDIRVHAWHLLPPSVPKGVILVLHGNAENISTHIHSVAWLAESGYELLLLDYRGFGHSEGAASLPGVFNDLSSAADWLEHRSQSQGIPAFWLGQSIGASLSSYYLSKHSVDGLKAVILDTPFASYRRIGREKFSEFWLTWPLQYPLSWLIDDQYSPERVADKWPHLPLLIFSSENDVVIPQRHTRDLVRQLHSGSESTIETVRTDTPHIGTYRDQSYRETTLRFLQENTAKR